MTSIDFIFKHANRQSQYTMFEIIVEIYLFLICFVSIVNCCVFDWYLPVIPFHLWQQSGFRQRKIEK